MIGQMITHSGDAANSLPRHPSTIPAKKGLFASQLGIVDLYPAEYIGRGSPSGIYCYDPQNSRTI